ncbi:MAG: Mur ligase family protein, partial [FCB group bacterium]|nr:Mur ligase family protein [FCB group bacterium]
MNAREYLFSLERHGIKLGLENITHLLEAANRPERAYPTIHVAGTNGKGSVVAMLDSILRAAGLRTGRFTSPHLIHLNERVLIDRQPIDDEELDDHLAVFRAVAEKMPFSPTFFEVITAAAFRAFAHRNVDVALIEVGMGGRFDSTNVITPLVSAVTSIALEHTRYLGNTLEEIA